MIEPLRYHRLRFAEDGQELLFANIGVGEWSFFHLDTGETRPHKVGPIYRSRAALLADAERYAREFGFRL